MDAYPPGAAPIRDAASVMLLRDGDAGLEVFTLTRAATMAFAAAATVFPGGGADPSDDLPPRAWEDLRLAPARQGRTFDDDDATLHRLLVTAVRETFEESGVLLGLAPSTPLPSPAAREAARRALEDHELTLWEFLTDHRLSPDFSALLPISRWITPPGAPRRYDTRFFLAELPPGQQAVHVTEEAVAAQWMRPAAALDRAESGQLQLMQPTVSMLNMLSGFSSVAEATALAAARAEHSPSSLSSSAPLRLSSP